MYLIEEKFAFKDSIVSKTLVSTFIISMKIERQLILSLNTKYPFLKLKVIKMDIIKHI